ncbi:hypothetical protein DRW07_06545 [Alteromonas sediminis]|uniref:Pyridoxine 5'-phosphate oxidase dimerisation C-terminal domain-containing protein n=2 Tax=Alteromonas sediminis TaxID=2259342 RepID=A0A3N5Y2U9_9ALTE|nr:hypothetical protein DRW07_06545 [Alteromonas sediminis]
MVSKLNAIWQAALKRSPLKQKSAVFVSTVDTDGYPQSRFVDLKRANTAIARPENWGGYVIEPLLIEFLTFNENRVHLREQHCKKGDKWHSPLLQP